MKKALSIAAILLAVFANAQVNLVPNPSFEDTVGCPQAYPDLDGVCSDWSSFRITPDYMNNCSSICGYFNQYGYQFPHSGQAYSGVATYHISLPEAREHLGAQLVSPLVIGTRYYVTFYACPAFNVQANIATNKLGVLFRLNAYSDPNGVMPLSNMSTIYSDSVLIDTLNWYKVSGSFIADSAYQFVVVGNFFDDNNIDTMHLPDLQFGNYLSYYYIDDICVSTDSLFAETWTSCPDLDHADKLRIFPNPTNETLMVQSTSQIASVEIYDLNGQLVISKHEIFAFESQLDVSNIISGIYVVKVSTANLNQFSELVITR